MFLSVFRVVQLTPQSVFCGIFIIPQRTWFPWAVAVCCPLAPLAFGNFTLYSLDLPILHLLCKWNHTVSGLLWLTSFPEYNFAGFIDVLAYSSTSFFMAESYFAVWIDHILFMEIWVLCPSWVLMTTVRPFLYRFLVFGFFVGFFWWFWFFRILFTWEWASLGAKGQRQRKRISSRLPSWGRSPCRVLSHHPWDHNTSQNQESESRVRRLTDCEPLRHPRVQVLVCMYVFISQLLL